MNDSLRDRIAAVLKEARIVSFWREGIDEADGQPYRSLVIRSDDEAAEYAADAVIAELKQQWRADLGYDGYSDCDTREEAAEMVDDFNAAFGEDWRDGEQAVVLHRYVTEWTADECSRVSLAIPDEAVARRQPDPVAEVQQRHQDDFLRKELEEIAKFASAGDIPTLCRWCGKYESRLGSEFCAECHQDENTSDLTLCQCGHKRGDHSFAGIRREPAGCLADEECLCFQFKEAQ